MGSIFNVLIYHRKDLDLSLNLGPSCFNKGLLLAVTDIVVVAVVDDWTASRVPLVRVGWLD